MSVRWREYIPPTSIVVVATSCTMSSKRWSTVLERKRIHMMCDAIHVVEDDVVRTMSMNSSDDDDTFLYSYNGAEQDHNSDCDLSLFSLSSLSSSSSSSLSTSSSSSSWSSISDDSISEERIEGLLIMMQHQHQRSSVNMIPTSNGVVNFDYKTYLILNA